MHPSRRVRSSSTTRIRMVGFASGGMESASNAPRGARVSDIPELRGTRSQVTGSTHGGRRVGPIRAWGALQRGCSFIATRCGTPAAPRAQCGPHGLSAQARPKTDDSAGDGRLKDQSYYVGVTQHRRALWRVRSRKVREWRFMGGGVSLGVGSLFALVRRHRTAHSGLPAVRTSAPRFRPSYSIETRT